MHNIRPSASMFLTILLVCGLTLSCDKHQSSAVGVVASVNGTEITQADIAFASRGASGGHEARQPASDKTKVLEDIILQELAYQKAVKLGLDADPKYLAELSGLQAQVNAFKRKKLSAMFLQAQLLNETSISDEEAQQYFNKNASRLRTEINVWQILSRNENTIKKVQAELAQGLAFEEVAAKQFPNLADSARKPWDSGYLQWNQIPEAWQNAINKMQIGDTSELIRGPNKRVWIIKLIDKRENKDLSFEQLKPKIIDVLKNEKARLLREKTIQNLRDNARIVYAK
ncbi:MAG: peptidyl-prolyl cis-trans isomerase [Gammaproteobacteria bacterium]|nr:peptidyl-prolyl cis-trans isomerase [Gammaproteobacteria bacterium]MCW8910742.1 peptidyl-prolyl cis-trans isomerase [Gammaproteobacteria bacterium]MCW9003645.1 peptidyl-prolyl cis-trans isomerase [Gammaproteobacteria bacterium]MCW9056796.1 peptidyl-prolyl cis-trans isomerase [Gammaproteobacteria bacterium]